MLKLSVRQETSKPSEWEKLRDYFWFLPKKSAPPKGYLPSPLTRDYRESHEGAHYPHVRLTSGEADKLKKIEEKIGVKLVGRFDNKDEPWAPYFVYLPLEISLKGKQVPMLSFLEKIRKHNPALIDNLISRVREKTGSKNQYRYDVTLQKAKESFPSFQISKYEARTLKKEADRLGWPVPYITKDDDEFEYEDKYFLPIRIKDRFGREVKVYKFLRAVKKLHDHDPEIQKTIDSLQKRVSLTPPVVGWQLIVSAEPSDILNMSTGKGWTSCMSEEGCNFDNLDHAVSARDMIAYAVAPKYKNWLARVWLRSDGKGGWWPESRVYGVQNLKDEDFLDAVKKYLKDRGILGKEGEYHIGAKGWSDFLRGEIEEEMDAKNEVERLKTEKLPEPKHRELEEWEGRRIRPPLIEPLRSGVYKIFVKPKGRENIGKKLQNLFGEDQVKFVEEGKNFGIIELKRNFYEEDLLEQIPSIIKIIPAAIEKGIMVVVKAPLGDYVEKVKRWYFDPGPTVSDVAVDIKLGLVDKAIQEHGKLARDFLTNLVAEVKHDLVSTTTEDTSFVKEVNSPYTYEVEVRPKHLHPFLKFIKGRGFEILSKQPILAKNQRFPISKRALFGEPGRELVQRRCFTGEAMKKFYLSRRAVFREPGRPITEEEKEQRQEELSSEPTIQQIHFPEMPMRLLRDWDSVRQDVLWENEPYIQAQTEDGSATFHLAKNPSIGRGVHLEWPARLGSLGLPGIVMTESYYKHNRLTAMLKFPDDLSLFAEAVFYLPSLIKEKQSNQRFHISKRAQHEKEIVRRVATIQIPAHSPEEGLKTATVWEVLEWVSEDMREMLDWAPRGPGLKQVPHWEVWLGEEPPAESGSPEASSMGGGGRYVGLAKPGDMQDLLEYFSAKLIKEYKEVGEDIIPEKTQKELNEILSGVRSKIHPEPKPGVNIQPGDIYQVKNWDDSVDKIVVLETLPHKDLVFVQYPDGEVLSQSLSALTHEITKKEIPN